MASTFPSFKKIRLIGLLIGLIVISLLIGLIRLSLAAGPPTGTRFSHQCGIYITTNNPVLMNSTCQRQPEGTFIHSLTHCSENYASYYDDLYPGNASLCTPINMLQNKYRLSVTLATCQNELQAKAAECNGIANVINWDPVACTGLCAPSGNCIEEYEAKVAQCGEAGIKNWNNDLCIGECNKDDCNEDDPCLEYSDWCIDSVCHGSLNVDKMICKSSSDANGCWEIEEQQCECKDTPPNDCDSVRRMCENKCGGQLSISRFYCDSNDPGQNVCECKFPEEEPDDPTPPDPPDPPDEDPDEPDPDPDPTEDPNGGDHDYTNSLLESIDENTESAVQNSKLTVERLDSTNQILNNIAENEHATASNTGKILDAINQLDDRELTLDDSGIIDAVNDVEDAVRDLDLTFDGLDDITDGTYTPGQLGDAYAITPETTNGFADRLSQFFTTVQTTGLFSLANSLTVGIPTSGTSTMTISAGQYGTHQYDFAAMGNALLTLRYVLLTVFGWVAIRIVLLKR